MKSAKTFGGSAFFKVSEIPRRGDQTPFCATPSDFRYFFSDRFFYDNVCKNKYKIHGVKNLTLAFLETCSHKRIMRVTCLPFFQKQTNKQTLGRAYRIITVFFDDETVRETLIPSFDFQSSIQFIETVPLNEDGVVHTCYLKKTKLTK